MDINAIIQGNGWIILLLTLIVGWLLGLLSRSGGGKWKLAYQREKEAHLALRKSYDEHLRTHGMTSDNRIPPYVEQRI
jgi:hypothetical protein